VRCVPVLSIDSSVVLPLDGSWHCSLGVRNVTSIATRASQITRFKFSFCLYSSSSVVLVTAAPLPRATVPLLLCPGLRSVKPTNIYIQKRPILYHPIFLSAAAFYFCSVVSREATLKNIIFFYKNNHARGQARTPRYGFEFKFEPVSIQWISTMTVTRFI